MRPAWLYRRACAPTWPDSNRTSATWNRRRTSCKSLKARCRRPTVRAGDLNGTTLEVAEGVGGSFQVGPDNEDFDRLVLDLPDLRASSTTLNLGKAAVTSQSSARATIALVDQAIGRISDERGRLGALLNRLGYTVSYSENEIESLQSSDASIRDADMAYESTRFTRSEILANTASAMMVQAFDNARLSLLLL